MNLWRTFDAKWSWGVCGSCLCSSPTRVLGSVVWSRHVNNQLTKTISVQLSVPGHLATFFEPFDLRFLRVAVQSTLERKPTAPHSIGALFRHRHCKHWRWSQSRQGGQVPHFLKIIFAWFCRQTLDYTCVNFYSGYVFEVKVLYVFKYWLTTV